jgi:hypothetical protein
MILVVGKNPLNQEIATQLPNINESQCFVVDIDQQFFTAQLSPEDFISYLLKNTDISLIRDIYLIVSEIQPNHPLGVFAHHLSRMLLEFHQKKINVHVISYLSSDVTLLVPPNQQDKQWKIVGINEENSKNLSYENLLANKNQKELFKNANLLVWLDDPQQTFDGTAYVWGE